MKPMSHILKTVLRRAAGNKGKDKFVTFCRYIPACLDTVYERLFELKHYYLTNSITKGVFAARLRRMGYKSTTEFTLWQMLGDHHRCFLPKNRQVIIDAYQKHPEKIKSIINAADQLLKGQFDLLGSGPRNMCRGSKQQGYKLNWRKDITTGNTYPRTFTHWRWNPFKLRQGNADMKGPWELGRLQHIPTIGIAYWLTGDDKYANYFAKIILDFIKHNKTPHGIQWACNMDVGLRVINIIAGIHFFQGHKTLKYHWWRKVLRALMVHGDHLLENLEYGTLNGQVIASNHNLSNLVGLYWLSMAFPQLDTASVWRGTSQNLLEQEILQQMLPDGVNFESSIPYHGLTTELLLSAYAMSVHHKAPFSKNYYNRLKKATLFLHSMRQLSGRLPRIGDDDSGRVHLFSDYTSWPREDFDHLLAAAQHVLGTNEIPHNPHAIETIFWAIPSHEITSSRAHQTPSLYNDAGFGILKSKNQYFLLQNSPVGTRGFGNHKHNDQMAIEWCVDGFPVFVDAGSYLYTQDADARNLFRSTAMHNTVMIDDTEQHDMNPEWLFKLTACGEGSLQVSDNTIHAAHSCYEKLPDPVTWQRVASISDKGLKIEDYFECQAEHKIQWQFLIHPDTFVKEIKNTIEISLPNKKKIHLHNDSNIVWQLCDAWYSPGYGAKAPCAKIIGTCLITRACEFSIQFHIKGI